MYVYRQIYIFINVYLYSSIYVGCTYYSRYTLHICIYILEYILEYPYRDTVGKSYYKHFVDSTTTF